MKQHCRNFRYSGGHSAANVGCRPKLDHGLGKCLEVSSTRTKLSLSQLAKTNSLCVLRNSQLECNLLVICGTVPTLKKFFRHMLPKLMGSADEVNEQADTPRVTPRTKANYGYNRRNPYAQFDDGRHESTELEMTRWDGAEGHDQNGVKGGVSQTVVIGGQTRATASDDDNSEKGIVETRSVIVERH